MTPCMVVDNSADSRPVLSSRLARKIPDFGTGLAIVALQFGF
jgi:hypothetical protein